MRILLPALAALALAALPGCAANYASMAAVPSVDGHKAFSVSGYTDWGVTEKAAAETLAEGAGRMSCPGGKYNVQRVDTYPMHNAFSYFLYWQAVIVCDA